MELVAGLDCKAKLTRLQVNWTERGQRGGGCLQ